MPIDRYAINKTRILFKCAILSIVDNYEIVKKIAKQDLNSFANIRRLSTKVCLTYFTDSND